jgi:type II secretory pathway component PulK
LRAVFRFHRDNSNAGEEASAGKAARLELSHGSAASTIAGGWTGHGESDRVEDLLAIRRITRARLEKLRPYITVSSSKKKPT